MNALSIIGVMPDITLRVGDRDVCSEEAPDPELPTHPFRPWLNTVEVMVTGGCESLTVHGKNSMTIPPRVPHEFMMNGRRWTTADGTLQLL
jgi:hypothetical protein